MCWQLQPSICCPDNSNCTGCGCDAAVYSATKTYFQPHSIHAFNRVLVTSRKWQDPKWEKLQHIPRLVSSTPQNPSIMSTTADVFQDHRLAGGIGGWRKVKGPSQSEVSTTNKFTKDNPWAQSGGVSLPEAQRTSSGCCTRPRASHCAVAPSFWGGECWTNLAAMTNSWQLGR